MTADNDRFNNRVALTVAVFASFVALSTIKGANVAEALQQSQAERNNGWAWYQAVRVREDMATYELAHLERLRRVAPTPEEAAAFGAEITAQQAEIARIRARLDEVRGVAQAAEKSQESLNAMGDQYDFAEALIAIAVTLLAVAALSHAHWLYWFALIPGVTGLVWGGAAMANVMIPARQLLAWLN